MHRYVVIDAFASEPLQGNPVAVFFDCDDLSGERMQRMAREMNLSESTFVLRPQQDGDARIRIFTPVNELPFAGHPLLGTAIALGAETDKDRLFLETRMGTVPFALERQDGKVVARRSACSDRGSRSARRTSPDARAPRQRDDAPGRRSGA